MIISELEFWTKIFFSTLLVMIGVIAFVSYFYLDIRRCYQRQENRWWVGVLVTILPFIGLSIGLFVWMLWNPAIRPLFGILWFSCLVLSIILGQSVTSPYKMADWWNEFGKWLEKRKYR